MKITQRDQSPSEGSVSRNVDHAAACVVCHQEAGKCPKTLLAWTNTIYVKINVNVKSN